MLKALVFLSSILIISCSGHLLQKRSVLGRGHRGGHRGGHHGSHHGGQHAVGRRQPKGRQAGRRFGRDGEHAPHDASAPADSYLPAADDYEYEEDQLAGYNPDQRSANGDDAQASYNNGGDQAQAQYQGETKDGELETSGQEQYNSDDELATSASANIAARASQDDYSVPEGSADDALPKETSGSEEGEASQDDYSAPRSENQEDYAAPRAESAGQGYSAASSRADQEYGSPLGDYSGPGNGFPFSSVEAAGGQEEGQEVVCPGDSLEACVEVCPGNTARVYGVCVGGCATRCP